MTDLRELPGYESSEKDGAGADASTELAESLSFRRNAGKRQHLDLLRVANAAKHIEKLPRRGESIHGIMRGNYNAWDIVPAIVRMVAPGTIDELCIATLGFNDRNADELLGMIDRGQVRAVRFICSCYFQATSAHIFKHMEEGLVARGQKIVAMRNHAKLILIRTTAGHAIAVESSANLRSCRNIEQFCMTNDSALYAFHRGWMATIFKEAA